MNRLSIRGRLVLLVGVLLTLLIVSAMLGIINSRRASATLGALYNDRVVPLQQLKEVADGYAVGIVDAAHKTRDGAFTPTEGVKAITQARAAIDKSWRAYIGTTLIPQEKALIAKGETLFKRADAAAERLVALMLANDADGLRGYAAKEMYPAIDPIAEVVGALMQVQLDVAAENYSASVVTANTVLWTSIVGVVLALVMGGVMAWMIIRSIIAPLKKAVSLAQAVAAGDLRTHIEVASSDETGRLLEALKLMNENLSLIVGQVRESAESVASGSSQISNGNANLSQRTEEQAANLEETAASMEELTATVKQNAETARLATQLAITASQVAAQGGTLFKESSRRWSRSQSRRARCPTSSASSMASPSRPTYLP